MRLGGRFKPYNGPRLRLVVGFLGLSFCAIFIRLAIVQLLEHASLRDLAARQYSRNITLHPERGRILDRHGRVLATSVPVPSAYAIPQEIDKPDAVAKQVAEVLGQPLATVQHQLTSTAPFVWLGRQLPPEVGERLQKLNLRGVQVLQETRRFYPRRHLAGQVLGFVGVDGVGLGGLEHLYNRELTGHRGRAALKVNASGGRVRIVDGDPSDRRGGAALNLTPDDRLKSVAEKEMPPRAEETQGKRGLVVIMNPPPGDFLGWR